MTSEDALVGVRVKVREGHHSGRHWGEEGTIKARWGDPGYVALDVEMDDGDMHLFWHHELERADNGHRNGNVA